MSYIEFPVSFLTYYRGITLKSNNLGLIAYQSSIVCLCILIQQFKFRRIFSLNSLLYFIFFFISLFFVLASQSRTAFIGITIGGILALLISIDFKKVKLNQMFLPIFLLIILYFTPLKGMFVDGILNKFIRVSDSYGVLAGRDLIWSKILQDSTLFGNGSSYFEEELGVEAHNSILHFVGAYGCISYYISGIFDACYIIFSERYNEKQESRFLFRSHDLYNNIFSIYTF